jgi:hypothetical protein
MSSFLKKRKKGIYRLCITRLFKRILGYPYFFFLKYILRFNNGLKKKFKRGKLNFFKCKTNAILGRQMN